MEEFYKWLAPKSATVEEMGWKRFQQYAEELRIENIPQYESVWAHIAKIQLMNRQDAINALNTEYDRWLPLTSVRIDMHALLKSPSPPREPTDYDEDDIAFMKSSVAMHLYFNRYRELAWGEKYDTKFGKR